jgi:SHS2 domain-containing protein
MIKIESHTADVRIRLHANTLEDLFSEGMKAIYTILQPKGRSRDNKHKMSVKLKGTDDTVFLIDFLNEVLSDSLIHKVVYHKISFFNKSEEFLDIGLEGYPVNSFNKDVKAVTYHEAEILQSKTGILYTCIIMDI